MTITRTHGLQFLTVCLLLVLWLVVSPFDSFAAERNETESDSLSVAPPANNNPATLDYGAAMLRTVVSLVIVILLLIALFLGIRWLQRKSFPGRGATEVLGIVGALSLGPKRNVTLVRIADRVLVVGSSEAGLSLLAELKGEEAATVLAAKGKLGGSFASTLTSQLSQLGRAKS